MSKQLKDENTRDVLYQNDFISNKYFTRLPETPFLMFKNILNSSLHPSPSPNPSCCDRLLDQHCSAGRFQLSKFEAGELINLSRTQKSSKYRTELYNMDLTLD